MVRFRWRCFIRRMRMGLVYKMQIRDAAVITSLLDSKDFSQNAWAELDKWQRKGLQ